MTNAEASLLGLLSEKPMHGYEMEKLIEERNMRYWTEISFFSIYRVLRKLESRGLVQSTMETAQNNISRKIYSVTKAGRKAVIKKIKDNLSMAERKVWHVDLSIANLDLIGTDEAIKCLERYIDSLDKAIDDYSELKRFFVDNGYPASDMALADRPLAHFKAEKKWAFEFLNTLKSVT